MSDAREAEHRISLYREGRKLLRYAARVLSAMMFLVLALALLRVTYYAPDIITAGELQPLENSLARVEQLLSKEGGISASVGKFEDATNQLHSLRLQLKEVTTSNPQQVQETLRKLDNVNVELAIIQNGLKTQKGSGEAALKDLRDNLEGLRARLTTDTSINKSVGTTLIATVNFLRSIIWPLIVLVIIFYLLRSPRALSRMKELLKPFKSFELFSAKFVLNDDIKIRAEETIKRYRQEIQGEYDRHVERKAISEQLRTILEKKILPEINRLRANQSPPADTLKSYRCTIHVPDVLFAETFYQLLDYLPDGGKKQGRTWSYRFGLIGKVWRSEKSLVLGQVPTDTDLLVKDWGMTKAEAERAGQDRQSFICVLLTHRNLNVGMFYMDAREQRAFGSPADHDRLREYIAKTCQQRGLTGVLSTLNEDMRGHAPLIRIYDKY